MMEEGRANDPDVLSEQYRSLRSFLVATSNRELRVARELWHTELGSYSAYRQYLMQARDMYFKKLKSAQALEEQRSKSRARTSYVSSEPTYNFTGLKYVLTDSSSIISALAFARTSNNRLAFANVEGDVFVAQVQDQELEVFQVDKVHHSRVLGMDWSYGDAYLVTAAQEGQVCIWDPDTGNLVRLVRLSDAACSCQFHPLNPTLLMVATQCATIVVINSNTGTILQNHTIPGPNTLQASGLICTNTHVYVSDSQGYLHAYKCTVKQGVLQPLTFITKMQVTDSSKEGLGPLDYIPFHGGLKCPCLLVHSSHDTINLVGIHDSSKQLKLELEGCCVLTRSARPIRGCFCPGTALSMAKAGGYITRGSEDRRVFVFQLVSAEPGVHPIMMKGKMVADLQGHEAPVVEVAWSMDETWLASGDCNGVVIIWRKKQD